MNRTNQMLLVALVLQALLIAGVSMGRDEVRISAPAPVLVGFEPNPIQEIEVHGPVGIGDGEKTQVTLKKTGTQWVVTTAGDYPADQEKVTKLLSDLKAMKTRGPVVSKASYHKKLEVADDKHQRKLVLKGGAAPVELFLGSSPAYKKLHVRLVGQDEVAVVDGLSTYDVGPKGADWVDKKYLDIAEKDVWAVKIQNKNGLIALEKDPVSGSWAALGLKPTDKPSKSVIDDLVRKSRSANLEEPVGKGDNPAWGLSQPAATVTLVTGTSTIAGAPPPKTEELKLFIGAQDGAKSRYYVKASNKDHTVLVPKWAVEPLLEKAPKDLVEK